MPLFQVVKANPALGRKQTALCSYVPGVKVYGTDMANASVIPVIDHPELLPGNCMP